MRNLNFANEQKIAKNKEKVICEIREIKVHRNLQENYHSRNLRKLSPRNQRKGKSY